MNVFTKLPDQLQKALEQEGYSEPTPIQKEAIPKVIAGSDLMGIAQTGTGKTAAFVLPILHRMLVEPKKGLRALILCPTRELAMQVSESIKTLAKHTKIKHTAVYGGVTQNPQVRSLKNGVDILVATPGRLFDLYDQGHIKLNTVEFFILDEADRMLDMGFIHDINKISALLPKNKQTLFFSATMSKTVSFLAQSLLNKPVRVEVTPEATPVEKIEQKVFFVDHENKVDLLLHLLEADHLDKVIIFVRTKRGADSLARVLKNNRISVQQIHGDRTQSQRTKTLDAFKGKLRCLIATDVAARGIDVENISHVINYDLPTDAENYVHRIGRTARAGKEGVAYSFCTRDDMPLLRAVQKSINAQIEFENHKFHSDSAKNSKIKIVPKRPRPSGGRGGSGRPSGGSRGPKSFGGRGKPRSSSFSKDKAPKSKGRSRGSDERKGGDSKPFKKGGFGKSNRESSFKKNDREGSDKPFKKGGFGKSNRNDRSDDSRPFKKGKKPFKTAAKSAGKSKNFAGSKGKRYEKAKNRRKDRFK